MQRFSFDIQMDSEALAQREKMRQEVYANPVLQAFVRDNHLDSAFVDAHVARLHEWLMTVRKCQGCQSLDSCRQRIKGKVPRLYVEDGLLSETLESCKKGKQQEALHAHRSCFRVFHGSEKDLEIQLTALTAGAQASREYKAAVTKGVESVSGSKGLYLFGPPGSGKTYMAYALANQYARKFLREQKGTVCFVKAPRLMNEIKQSLEDVHWRQRLINDLRKCTVLILDDLGSESVTSWTRDEILFPLLDERMQKGLKTYFTSNYDLKGLEEHYQKDRQQVAAMRLMERISTLSDAVMVPGPSRRK